MERPELKPCPFCGDPAETLHARKTCGCSNLKCFMAGTYVSYERWNQRAASKTLGTKDISEALGKSAPWVRKKLQALTEEEKETLGIYENSGGYQVPSEALMKPPFTIQPGSRWGKGGASEKEQTIRPGSPGRNFT